MLHKEFWGLLFLGFVFWVILAANPTQRIENVCRPIGWTGNVVTSASALVMPAQQATIQGGFDKVEYGCRYTVWRLFYQDAYNQWLNSSGEGNAATGQESTSPAQEPAKETAPAAPSSAPDQLGPPAPIR